MINLSTCIHCNSDLTTVHFTTMSKRVCMTCGSKGSWDFYCVYIQDYGQVESLYAYFPEERIGVNVWFLTGTKRTNIYVNDTHQIALIGTDYFDLTNRQDILDKAKLYLVFQ